VSPDGTQQVTISAAERLKFQPADVSVRVSQPLQLTLQNADQSIHDLTLNEALAEPVKLTVNGGQTTTGTITFDTPGSYQFECSQPGHAWPACAAPSKCNRSQTTRNLLALALVEVGFAQVFE
jgi:plastocyanin